MPLDPLQDPPKAHWQWAEESGLSRDTDTGKEVANLALTFSSGTDTGQVPLLPGAQSCTATTAVQDGVKPGKIPSGLWILVPICYQMGTVISNLSPKNSHS